MVLLGTVCLALAGLAGSRAHLESSTALVQIGQPFELTIVVEHSAGTQVKLPEPAALPRSFAFIADLGTRRAVDPVDPGTTTTRATWRIMALEGGESALPALDVGLDTGGLSEVLHAQGPQLVVAHALNEGEDVARPARGFRDTPDLTVGSMRPVWIALVAVAVLLVAVLVWFARRRKPPVVAAELTCVERLTELERRAEAEPENARAVTFALTALLRTAIDEHVGESRAALLDSDWSAAVARDMRVPETARAVAAKFLAESERIKYAGETPSVLALRDAFHQLRTALAALSTGEKAAA